MVYLKSRSSGIKAELNPSIDSIVSDLSLRPLPVEKGLKVDVWCEDLEAKWFLGQILSQRIKAKCNMEAVGLSCGELGELAAKEIQALADVLFVVDADANTGGRKKIENCGRRFVLPGGGESPEKSVYTFLSSLDDEDELWSKFQRGYSKQIFKKNYIESKKKHLRNGGKEDRRLYKAWFKDEKAQGFWGQNGAALSERWKAEFNNEIKSFVGDFEKRVDAVLGRMKNEK